MSGGGRRSIRIVGGAVLTGSPFLSWMGTLFESATGLTTAWGMGTGVVGVVVLLVGLSGRSGSWALGISFVGGALAIAFPTLQWLYLASAEPKIGLHLAYLAGLTLVLVERTGGSD